MSIASALDYALLRRSKWMVTPSAMTRRLHFPGGPGPVTTPVDFEQNMQSLEQRLFTLPDDTRVYPGHGDDTTLGRERASIPEWRERGW